MANTTIKCDITTEVPQSIAPTSFHRIVFKFFTHSPTQVFEEHNS